VLEGIKASLETIPDAVVERNSVLPDRIPDGGLIILRDGDPGEPEHALGGIGNVYYQHAVEIEIYVEEGDAAVRDAAFDGLLRQIGAALEIDPTLGGGVRSDLRPTGAEHRGGCRRTGDQDRDAHHHRRLRERCSAVLMPRWRCVALWAPRLHKTRSSRCRESARQ
jgi:hypothetical protein